MLTPKQLKNLLAYYSKYITPEDELWLEMSLDKRLEVLMSRQDEDVHWKWVQACMEVIDEIDNEWENNFINDLHRKMTVNPKYSLSPRQAEILERIYADKTK